MAELEALRAAVLAALDDPDAAAGVDAVGRVCRACVRLLPVDGAAVSIMSDAQNRETVYASDAVSVALGELQFSLGEGPCFQAYATGGPVLVPDLAKAAAPHWPVFAAQVADYPVGALFTFPVQIGTIRLATLDTYRTTAGPLSAAELSVALQVADIAALALSGLAAGDDSWLDEDGRWLEESSTMRHRQVHQATGVLIIQLELPAGQALSRMRAYAFSHDRPLADIAADIVGRRLLLVEDQG
ncbi:MAG: GAF domain-containing protein [Acidimicrobiales bacterium]|nr:MAG: GAF domain-containing protein [Acidimicrobiales bacterium]